MLMNVKQANTEVNRIMRALKQGLPTTIFAGISEPLTEAIGYNIPTVTGTTIMGFKPMFSGGGNVKGVTIVKFIKTGQAAELLELGVNAPVYNQLQSKYPQKGDGYYVPYAGNPHLRDWAIKKGLTEKFKDGVVVGNPSTTHWGKGRNKWLTQSVYDVKIHTGYASLNEHMQLLINSIKR